MLIHVTQQALPDLRFGTRPQHLGHDFAGPYAHAVGHVVRRDHQVLLAAGTPIQHDVGVGVVSVPVVYGHPVQLSLEIDCHAAHELAGEASEVFQFQPILGRDDEAELMPVTLSALLKRLKIRRVSLSPVGLPLLPIACNAVSLDVTQVLRHRIRAGTPKHDEAGLDDHTPRVRPQALPSHGGRHATAPEGIGRSAKVLA